MIISISLSICILFTSCNKTTSVTEIIFPAHELNKTEHNAEIFDIEPFKLTLELPSGWTIIIPENKDELKGGFSSVNIYNNDYIGCISYNTFIIYEGTTEENFYRSVYNQLMLGSMVNWDFDYTPVKEDENNCAATCKIMQKLPNQNEPSYSPGILAYNKDLLVYISIAFDEDTVTDDELKSIAESITLSQ